MTASAFIDDFTPIITHREIPVESHFVCLWVGLSRYPTKFAKASQIIFYHAPGGRCEQRPMEFGHFPMTAERSNRIAQVL